MTDRTAQLLKLRSSPEDPLWAIALKLNETLASLVTVPHFDPRSDGAVGSVIHSALPLAADASVGEDSALKLNSYREDPANKLEGCVNSDGQSRPVSIEFHIADRRGCTAKSGHQFSIHEDEHYGRLFDEDQDPSVHLLFVAYVLSATKTTIERMFLVYADGKGQEKVELRQIESLPSVSDDNVTEHPQPAPSIKLKDSGEEQGQTHVANQSKRRNDTTGS